MRPITVKYAGECRKCNAQIPEGAQAIYEKRVGIFCVSCAPTDPEAIRELRQEAADRRADRYEEWASKREERATAVLNSHKDIRSDIAFNTQPGHIPFRARLIAQDDRAYESLNVAQSFREKADRLRHVRVAGDAQRAHDAKDAEVRAKLSPGKMADWMGRPFKVLKVNKKTATLESGYDGGHPFRVELHLLKPIEG